MTLFGPLMVVYLSSQFTLYFTLILRMDVAYTKYVVSACQGRQSITCSFHKIRSVNNAALVAM